MFIIFFIGRILFGGYFLYNGIQHIARRHHLTGYAKAKGVPLASVAVVVSGIILILGGVSILLNHFAFIGIWLLILFLVPTTFMMHAFWKETDGNVRMLEQVQFLKNLCMTGALLMMLALG